MEYERIEKKLQKSIISPTKLRMKLMGPHHNKKKEGSNSNSSRTSPSRLQVAEDIEVSMNSLLAANSYPDDHNHVLASSTDVGEAKHQNDPVSDLTEIENQASKQRHDAVLTENDQLKPQQLKKNDLNIPPHHHPHILRSSEDENLDYDSNASSSSFEFHRGRASRAYPSRQIPSKWNDAEKWIMSRQNMIKKNGSFCGQANRMPIRVVPDNGSYEQSKPRIDPSQPSIQSYGGNLLIDQSTQSNDTTSAGLAIRSVCMRDMGTEMTPIPSQEPSRSVTPVDATTPLRSPSSSLPSTPRGGGVGRSISGQENESLPQNTRRELSEEEVKVKTRREIVALGVQLGKMNIAAWASKEGDGNNENVENSDAEELQRIEFEKRAAAWEEVEKSKHTARYKREEIRIQAWESQEKAKLEAEMRRIEAKVEQMKAEAEAKMVKKIAMAKQRSEEKRASAEARIARDTEKAAAEAEYIRQTGRIPTSNYKICCGWFS